MKKTLLILLAACFLLPACAETNEAWDTAPVITKAYELSSGKLYLEWEGSAPLYQVYMDGQSIGNTVATSASFAITGGTHAIMVYPISETKSSDTTIGIDLSFLGKMGVGLSADLAAFGLNPKDVVTGKPSTTLNIDYLADSLFDVVPDKVSAQTDFDDHVQLTFADRYGADEYVVSISRGKETSRARFNVQSEDAKVLIQKEQSLVTITLDAEYLMSQGCMVPEIGEKYSFAVQLRKYASDYLTGEKEMNVFHESKNSAEVEYTPVEVWKTAPVITYASQTADGKVTLQWEHEDGGRGCDYEIVRVSRAMRIRTGAEVIGKTAEKEFVVEDLMNGGYCFEVVPCLEAERGTAASEVDVEVKNDWVVAPELVCEVAGAGQVKLTWMAAEGVETYHITVHAGNNDSLLRYIDMDYAIFEELEIPAETGEMEYMYAFGGEIDPAVGRKLKIEMYGIRHTADGSEQKSATSMQRIVVQ